MASAIEERIRQLTAPMLRKKLFVVISRPIGTSEEIAARLPEHLEYMIGIEKQGHVFASGPLNEPGGSPRGDGMTILRAGSHEEARSIAQQDPLCAAGLRSFEVREWTIMEGSLSLKARFSDRSIEVE